MNMLTEPMLQSVEYCSRRYRTCCSFDTVLEVQRLYKDKELTDVEKLEQALRMLTQRSMRVWALPLTEKVELLSRIYKEQIQLPQRPKIGKQIRTVDFALDSVLIYAGFMQDYGVDLVKEQGRMHWKKFITLFQGLSEQTKIREVMKIRAMDVPVPNQHNYAEIQRIQELKSYWALPVEGGGGQQGLDALFGALEKMAE